MAFFSAYDTQTGGYFHSGLNSHSREQCMEDVLEMLVEGDCGWIEEVDFEGFKALPSWELLEHYQVEIHEHQLSQAGL